MRNRGNLCIGGSSLNKLWNNLKKDLWIVVLDILIVNVSYYLAVLFRFYIRSFEFRPAVTTYLNAWARFAPFYTVLSIVVFVLFKLYGGMWRYAGINDMNRVIGANAVTALIQILGTVFFVCRMPVAYYLVGAVLQFFFMSMLRFGYRIFMVEKKKINDRKVPGIPALIIGAGETGRRAIKQLEDNTPYRAVAVVDAGSAGKTMDGIPVVAEMDQMMKGVKTVFIADPSLSLEARARIRKSAEDAGLEVRDYTGYLSNLGGRVPLSSLLELTDGPVTIVIGGQSSSYPSGEQAIQEIGGRYDVVKVKGNELTIELKEGVSIGYAGYDAWAQQHKEETGEEVSFF